MRSLPVRSLCAVVLAGLLPLCAVGARAQGERGDVYRLFLPGNLRALDIDLRQFDVEYVDLPGEPAAGPNKGGRARLVFVMFRAEKGKRKLPAAFYVRVEEVRADAPAEALRETAAERLLKHGSVSKGSVRREAYKETALLRYTVKGPWSEGLQSITFTGLSPIPVRNSYGSDSKYSVLEAFQVQGGVWVWIRNTSGGPVKDAKGDEEAQLRTLLDSARVVDTSQPSTSFDYFHLGRALYQQKEYEAAAAALSKALDLERAGRQLSQPNWRQLIMALANAHGAADDPARAREVLEYAVAAEPTYPYFHHGLARLHGFFGDADKSIASLEKAYEFAPKPEGFLARGLPDPLTDAAFAKFKDDPKFRDAVKAMKKKWKK